ncbi:unnamed protein product [Debaryomyces tyrocola]|nr:unnamed protein product [Debaryomyces tyrocola]
MIISKRNHLEKMEMAKPLKSLIDDIKSCPLEELPHKLKQNLSWERPRGDLFHWVPALNRFDEIFETQVKKYELDQEHPKLQEMDKKDQELLVACLQFTHLLLEHCANRSIYSSGERIFQLINSPTVDVRLSALEVGVSISERYVQTSSNKYSAPKPVKMKVLQIAKSYPLPVPPNFHRKVEEEENISKEDKDTVLGDHYSLIDSITTKRKYPSKWKHLNFQYYKAYTPQTQNIHTKSESAKSGKEELKNKGAKRPKSKSNSNKLSKTDNEEKIVPKEGVTSFSLSEETVRKLSLEQIFDKASETIPKEYWFEFGLVAPVVKSFNTKSYDSIELREKLLRAKCLAIAFICCMCPSEFTASRFFESEPYIFSFLIDLIQPENSADVSRDVYFTATKALECISLKRVWGSDIIRCMGGNVNHGILFQCIRHINRKIRVEDDDCFELAYVHFFNMLGNLIDSKSLTPRLTAGGILNDLLSFFNVKSKYRWSCSAAVHLTTVFLSASPESFDDFVANNGFQLLIDTIKYEVNFALENPNYGGGPPKESLVYYNITFRQANYIRNLMKLVSHLIQSEPGDRLRNLFDSPLLESFNQILLNPKTFGPLILSATIDSVFYIIHNEPTAFSILNEAKVIDTILDNFEDLFLPSNDLLMSLAEVIGAICLNNDGLDKVMNHNTIGKYFQSFYNLDYAKELVRSDMTTNLGCSFDELGRHYTPLKPIIMEEIKKLVKNVPDFVNSKLNGIRFYTSDKGSLYRNKDEEIIDNEDGSKEIEVWETTDAAYLADNVFFFLGGLLQDSGQWGNEAMKLIPYESWASFMTLSNAPFDYTTSNGFSTLMGVLKYFDDENRDYGLPLAFEILKKQVESPLIQEFIHFKSTDISFFSKFENNEEAGTHFLKELNSLNTLFYTFTEIYINPGLMFHERYHQIAELFGNGKSADGSGLRLLSDFGLLLRRCMLEEIILRSTMPDTVAKQSGAIFDSSSEFPPIQIYAAEPSKKQEKQDGTSAKFKNSLQIRFFAYRFQNYISTVFCCLGRVCMHKRQEFIDAAWRRDAVRITVEIGKIFETLITTDISNEEYKSSYFLVLVNIGLYCLSQKERVNKDVIQTSLAISLLQNGFIEKLKELAIGFWNKLLQLDPQEVAKTNDLKYISTSESSITKNVLSQILMIFAKIVNSDVVPNLPATKLFYHEGLEKDPESFLVSAFLVQSRIIALELIRSTVGSESIIFNQSDIATTENVPSPLIEQLVYIAKHVWMATKEVSDIPFVPLIVDNVSPPLSQVQYLTSKGISPSQAEHFFKHTVSLNEISSNEVPDCSQLDVDKEVWESIVQDIHSGRVSFKQELPTFKPGSHLKTARLHEFDHFTDCWFKVACNYHKAIESIADMLLSSYSDPSDISSKLAYYIFDLVEVKKNKNSDLGVAIHLFGIILKDEKVVYSNKETISRFTRFMIDELESNPKDVDKDYISYGLYILEQVMYYNDFPESEKSPHERLSPQNDTVPFLIDDELKRRVFDSLIKLDEIHEIKSAIGIARIMILLVKDEECSTMLVNSKLLKTLISLASDFMKSASDKYDIYQAALVVLIRRCFETTEVLRVNMSVELSTVFKGSIRGKRDLQSVLKETASVVLRDPGLYVDVFSQDVRLDNYDGGDVYPSKLTVFRKKHDKSNEDMDMEDVEASKEVDNLGLQRTINSTGIIHTLLTELMEVSKKDWVSEPQSTDDEKTAKDSTTDVFKNTDFAYASFLLQTITELLGSYKQSKLEFLTFSKKNQNENLKPRSTALNFLLHQLIPTRLLIKSSGIEFERRSAISSLSKLAVLALVSTPILNEDNSPDPKKEDIDMAFIRKFYVDILLKILKETASAPSVANIRYGKLIDLFDLCGCMITQKFRDLTGPLLNKNATKYDQYYIAKALIDKQIPSQLTGIISEFDVNFPEINRVIKLGIKPLTLLGKIKSEFQDVFEDEHQGDKEDDDIVPEDVDDRDETPDLFRNSTLGMYDVDHESEDSEMDYYDEGDPLEVLMSGEEISEEDSEDSSHLSELESEMEEDEDNDISIDEGYEGNESMDDDNIPSIEDDDIEIIDELDMHSHSDSDEGSINDEMSDESGVYDYDEEEGISDYDDEELDGWIEAFEGDNAPSNEAEVEEGDIPSGVESLRRNRLEHSRDAYEVMDSGDSDEDEEDNMSEDDSVVDDEVDGLGIAPDSRRRARDFASTFFDALRPAMGQPNIASLFEGLFSSANNDNGLLRGTIHISGPGNSTRFERSFGNVILMGSKSKRDNDVLHSMYIKSTRERWLDALNMFYSKSKDDAVMKIIPNIVNRIEKESIEIFKLKKEEAERIRKEREEKIRKREEEERLKREEEARERELNATNNSVNHDPIMVRIGDRDVDISGTDIDPEFFEALPDDMRDEVFTQHVRERRANASNTGADAREIDPDFLDALPEQIREEILQQESMARRFSTLEDEMTYPDVDEDEDEDLEDEDEGESTNPFVLPSSGSAGSNRRRSTVAGDSTSESSKKSKKVFFTPLVERSGVAALIRLLFIPLPINQREYIHQALQYLCKSKQSRAEIMGLLIAILQDGLINQRSIEKVYSQVCLKAKTSTFNTESQNNHFPIGGSPIIIGNQIIEVVHYILERNTHMRYYLLTEHDNPYILKKINRKTKLKESLSKESKYPINLLLRLLENNLIKEDQTFMDVLARVLQIATRPLHALQNANKSVEDNKVPPITPPVIPDHNFRQIIKILTSNDCPNTTFRRTISAMQNLSVLPNAQKVFSVELSDQATKLGQTIISDLNVLTKEIAKSDTYNTENKSFAKFSASSSDQAKLLRILTALDYMFESKEKDKGFEDEKTDYKAIHDGKENKLTLDEIEELTGLYKRLALGTLWDALSDCLRVLEERKGMTNIATALLPLIEALMVVCKHSKVKEIHIKDAIKYEAKKIDFTKEPIESLFFSFTDEHKKILNQMVRTNPNLMSGPFGMLVRNPGVLEFDNKKNYFDRKLHENKNENAKLSINIRRDQVFLDSYRALFFKPKDEFKNSKLEVNFKGESGIDAGGVTREWYQVLSRQMFNPDYALFTPVASDETTFHPNRTSYINPEHLSFFKFIGKIIGKAIFDNSFLDCHFSRAVYKRILGKSVSLKDMETLDLEYFKSLVWMLENDITDVITEDFSVETDDYGEHKIIDLIPNGRDIAVTEENKHEYVKLVVQYRLQTSVTEQMDNFLLGFHEIISKDLVSIFDEQELELLISGLPDIDVLDWQNNSTYNNYSPSSEQIQWFWRAVKSFDNEERAKLLQFATGTSKVPLNGFKELSGASGTCKFSIHRDYGTTDRLPSSHTCFNQIDLPAYESYETLRGSVLLAITEGHEGFGLA